MPLPLQEGIRLDAILPSREEIRLNAIKLYINGLPILVQALKGTISSETQDIVNKLSKLLPACNSLNTDLTFWGKTVTIEKFQEFVEIVGETTTLLAKVDIDNLYE
jgi:hypothetical protein|tara:strand:+ start:693 stop:1010 length:318 start_codon:yes stop_codon:yes gene_type:complete